MQGVAVSLVLVLGLLSEQCWHLDQKHRMILPAQMNIISLQIKFLDFKTDGGIQCNERGQRTPRFLRPPVEWRLPVN